MQIVQDILSRNALSEPDGRLLLAYNIKADEVARLCRTLTMRVMARQVLESTARGFVLWASERIRTDFAGGQLSWEFVFDGLSLPHDRDLAIKLTELGLAAWRRPLRKSDNGNREFLYSLFAEGGLPDRAIAEGRRYRNVLLNLIREVEGEGTLAPAAAPLAAHRVLQDLPQVFRTDEQARLLSDLALSLIALREALPADLPEGAAESWLDANNPGWRMTLPLRLSPEALHELVRPALSAERGRGNATDALVERQLRRRTSDGSWIGVARVQDSALLPETLLGGIDRTWRLRLLTDGGSGFLGVPEPGGWRLMRNGGRGPVMLPLSPDEAVVLSVHANGRELGDVVLDAGFPGPDEAVSLWRPTEGAGPEIEVLVPLAGHGRTKNAKAFVLAPRGLTPSAAPGIEVGPAEPGPGGVLWAVSGQGRVRLGEQFVQLATGASEEEPRPYLQAFGRRLQGFSSINGTPVFLGPPAIMGAEGGGRSVSLARQLKYRVLPRLLGGQIVEWSPEDVVLARLRLVELPQDLNFRLIEVGQGRLCLEAEGVPAGLHLSLAAGEAKAQTIATAGRIELDLHCDQPQGLVSLRLSNPVIGASLDLIAVWPARSALLVDPDGHVLATNRRVSLAGLSGWRAALPPSGGSLQLRSANRGVRVAFRASGTVRLTSYSRVIDQALALENADGRINLRLVAGGQETPRLEIGRYDWTSDEAGPFRHLGAGTTHLQAICLDEPTRTASTDAAGRVDVAGWLGTEGGPWFIQGRSDLRGVMRPFVWSARPVPHTSREGRLEYYAKAWRVLMDAADDRGWDDLWTLIQSVRTAGDASALDQVQALARVPQAAVALLLRVTRDDRAAALALEADTPIWWPLVPCAAWESGLRVARENLLRRLQRARIDAVEANTIAAEGLRKMAGELVALRPELKGHLGRAMAATELPPLATDLRGNPIPLAVPAPRARLRTLAQEAARRLDAVPQGAGHLRATVIADDFGLSSEFAPLLHAPLVVAEVAAGRRDPLSSQDVLQMIALRATDTVWFDEALPAALSLALEFVS